MYDNAAMCSHCLLKGLWHTDENQQLENFISGFTKKKKKPIYVRPAAPVAPASTFATITLSSSATIVSAAQPSTAAPALPQQAPVIYLAEQLEEELAFIEPAGLGGDNPLA